ncbi:helix-turn-helix domain-containing protein [Streptomyces sp. NPDC047014]|uniref:helix-turn-helix domain-containing protein n=1 Tax=Streptomyces sp. NPDC047014 TaxID=3155736 RepID=UPI0033D42F19
MVGIADARVLNDLRHFTPEEAAGFLPVSSKTLRKWVYERRVPHHKLGGNTSFSVADIRAMCALAAVAPLPAFAEASESEAGDADEPAGPPGTVPTYLTVDEAAEILRCSAQWLRDGVNHRGLPHARLGRLIFTQEDIAEIYRMHRVPARPARGHRARGRRP